MGDVTKVKLACCAVNTNRFRPYVLLWMALLFLPGVHHHESPSSSLVAISGANSAPKNTKSACYMLGCNCTLAVHYAYRVLNCTFNNTQVIDLVPGSIPSTAQEINIHGGRRISFSAKVFTPLRRLDKVRVQAANELLVKKHSFLNLATAQLFLEIVDCSSVIFETAALKGINGTLKGSIYRSAHVVIQSNAFSYLLDMKISHVPMLDLARESFKFEYPPPGKHGPTTTIHLYNVIIQNLPRDTFSTSAALILIENCEIRTVHEHAFSANTLTSVEMNNTSLHTVEAHAFSNITLVHNLELKMCRIKALKSKAIYNNAVSKLTMHFTRITEVESDAINIVAANISIIACEFDKIHTNGIDVKQWNRLDIVRSTFRHLEREAINVSLDQAPTNFPFEIAFISNEIYSVVPSGLKFITDLMTSDNKMLYAKFETNLFLEPCNCDIKKWLGRVLGSSVVFESIVDTSFCSVKALLANCFNINEGLVKFNNFTDAVCNNNTEMCPSGDDEKIGVIETVTKEFSARNDDTTDSNSHWILVGILSVVFLIAMCGAIVMLLVKGGIWLKRKGYCVRFSGFEYSANDEIGTTEAEDIMVTVENKINENENLPSELTPELLQTLREKLEDPATYNEAREMIERLYDHFLVEETYNNNDDNEPEDAHLYEELNARPPPTEYASDKSPSQPARPFSFLRLIEERFNLLPEESPPTLIGEYSEPMDAEPSPAKSSDVHVYSELPESKGGKMAFRPLPAKPRQRDDPGEGTSAQEFKRRF